MPSYVRVNNEMIYRVQTVTYLLRNLLLGVLVRRRLILSAAVAEFHEVFVVVDRAVEVIVAEDPAEFGK